MPAPTAKRHRIEYAAKSDVGMRRAINQDSLVAVTDDNLCQERGSLFIVADGMGAHAAGELASELAVNNVPHEYKALRGQPAPVALRQAIQKVNGLIHAKGQSSPEFQGMGTTCASLVVLGDAALVAHVGDSRVYRSRGLALEQLTFDHSLVWELAQANRTTEDKVPSCIPKNVITRSLGPHPVVNVDLEGPFELAPGDAYLICSDGLTGVVGDELIAGVLATMPPDEAAQTLIDLANLRGGPDNVSVIIVHIGEAATGNPAGVSPNSPPSLSAVAGPPGALGKRGGEQAAPRDPVRWLAMAASVACLAVVIWCIREQQTWGAVAAAIGLGGAAVRALGKLEAPREAPCLLTLGGPYGSAPYKRCECGADAVLGQLNDVADQLAGLRGRNGATNGAAGVNWGSFDALRQRAAASADWREATRLYGAAIRGLMSEVRRAPGLAEKTVGATPPDSVIE